MYKVRQLTIRRIMDNKLQWIIKFFIICFTMKTFLDPFVILNSL